MTYFNNVQLKLLIFSVFTFIVLLPVAAQDIDETIVTNLSTHILKICDGGDSPATTATICNDNTLWATNDINELNEITIMLTAYAVDVHKAGKANVHNTPEEGISIPFPENYPTPVIRYEYSPQEYLYTEALEYWSYEGEYSVNNGPTHSLYSSSRIVNIALPESYSCETSFETVQFYIDARLMTYSDETQSYENYPVHLYGEADDIFSCDIFFDTKYICDDTNQTEPETDILVCIPCKHLDIHSRSIESTNFDNIKILANPFSNKLQFSLETKSDSDILISLLTATGQNIFESSISTTAGINNFDIPTTQIPSGIYYLSTFSEGRRLVQKVVCVK